MKPELHRRRRYVKWTKRTALAVLAAGALAAVAVAWLPKPIPVEIAIAQRGPLEVVVVEEGRTRVRARFVVSAPIGGNLERLAIEAGREVRLGEVLGRVLPPTPALLDPRNRDEAAARLAAATAHRRIAELAVARATATRDQAIREAARARQLVAREAISVAERDRLELAERVAIADRGAAELDRTAADAEVDAARAALGSGATRGGPGGAPIPSPVAGRVLKVIRDSAGPVTSGAPLLELGDPRDLEVCVDVLSSDATRIAPGMAVALEAWGGERALHGRVRAVEPGGFTKLSALGVEEQRVNVLVSIDDAPASLGDGFRVEARIVIWQGDALLVPASAVFRDHDRWAVYLVAGHTVRLVPVAIGRRGRTELEVVSGIAAGDAVVLHPSDNVQPGARVTLRR